MEDKSSSGEDHNEETANSRLPPGYILCVGLPLLDICFFGDKQFLSDFRLKANDALVPDEDRFKEIYRALKTRYRSEYKVPGGSCQNVARTVQWLLGDYPKTVTYMGAVGVDKHGHLLKQKVSEAGVDGVYQTVDDGKTLTGVCLVILNDKERSLVANTGAAACFQSQHVDNNWNTVENANLIYVEGFFLPYGFEAAMKLAKHVASNPKKRFLLNLSAEYVTTVHRDLLVQLMPYVDILFGNIAEATSFAKALGFVTNGDVRQIAKMLSAMDKERRDLKRFVVITRGAEPVVVATSPESSFESQVPALKQEQIVDTTGAGDAFVGGVLAQLLRGKPLNQEAIRSGSNAAWIVIQRLGCTFPQERPNLDQLCL